MTTQFIVNEKGERISAIIPISDFEDLLNAVQIHMEPTEEYKAMMDEILKKIESGEAKYTSLEELKKKLPHHEFHK